MWASIIRVIENSSFFTSSRARRKVEVKWWWACELRLDEIGWDAQNYRRQEIPTKRSWRENLFMDEDERERGLNTETFLTLLIRIKQQETFSVDADQFSPEIKFSTFFFSIKSRLSRLHHNHRVHLIAPNYQQHITIVFINSRNLIEGSRFCRPRTHTSLRCHLGLSTPRSQIVEIKSLINTRRSFRSKRVKLCESCVWSVDIFGTSFQIVRISSFLSLLSPTLRVSNSISKKNVCRSMADGVFLKRFCL